LNQNRRRPLSRYTILAFLLALPLAFLVGCPTNPDPGDDDDSATEDDDDAMDDDDSVVDDDDVMDDDDSGGEPCIDDALEENDEEVDASVITPPVADLVACPSDDDWYELTVAEGTWTLSITFTHANGDIDATLWGPDGSIGSGISSTDNEEFEWTVPAGGQTYTLEVRYYEGGDDADDPGNVYGIELAETVPPTCDPDDGFEENDDEASAAVITAGNHTGLNVCEFDADWYSIDLAEGDEITIEVLFIDEAGDIDIEFIDPAGDEVDSGSSMDDNEVLDPFTVPVGGAGVHLLLVELYSDDDTVGTTYDMNIGVVTGGT